MEKLFFIIVGATVMTIVNFDLTDLLDLSYFVLISVSTFTCAWFTGIDIAKRICRLADKYHKPRR